MVVHSSSDTILSDDSSSSLSTSFVKLRLPREETGEESPAVFTKVPASRLRGAGGLPVLSKVRELMGSPAAHYHCGYRDDDGDLVVLSSDEDLQEALQNSSSQHGLKMELFRRGCSLRQELSAELQSRLSAVQKKWTQERWQLQEDIAALQKSLNSACKEITELKKKKKSGKLGNTVADGEIEGVSSEERDPSEKRTSEDSGKRMGSTNTSSKDDNAASSSNFRTELAKVSKAQQELKTELMAEIAVVKLYLRREMETSQKDLKVELERGLSETVQEKVLQWSASARHQTTFKQDPTTTTPPSSSSSSEERTPKVPLSRPSRTATGGSPRATLPQKVTVLPGTTQFNPHVVDLSQATLRGARRPGVDHGIARLFFPTPKSLAGWNVSHLLPGRYYASMKYFRVAVVGPVSLHVGVVSCFSASMTNEEDQQMALSDEDCRNRLEEIKDLPGTGTNTHNIGHWWSTRSKEFEIRGGGGGGGGDDKKEVKEEEFVIAAQAGDAPWVCVSFVELTYVGPLVPAATAAPSSSSPPSSQQQQEEPKQT